MDNYPEHQENCLFRAFEKIVEDNGAIPFSLITKKGELFSAVASNEYFECVISPVFEIKKLDKKTGCVVLSALIPIDMEGCPVDLCSDLYSLLSTNTCITLDINCFCGVVPLPACLLNRYIPIIEPKC